MHLPNPLSLKAHPRLNEFGNYITLGNLQIIS